VSCSCSADDDDDDDDYYDDDDDDDDGIFLHNNTKIFKDEVDNRHLTSK
jgi:hypothetical protein